MKCRSCNQDKLEEDFGWRNRKFQQRATACKQCRSAYNKDWEKCQGPERNKAIYDSNQKRRKRLAIMLDELKATAGCADCGQDDPLLLDFDHLSDKIMGVSALVKRVGASRKRIFEEIAKCEVVCAYCHRKRTRSRLYSSMDRTVLS